MNRGTSAVTRGYLHGLQVSILGRHTPKKSKDGPYCPDFW